MGMRAAGCTRPEVPIASNRSQALAATNASLQATEEVSASYDRQFLAGRKSWLDVMNAARELAQTESQWADLKATQVVLTWRLAAYTRGIAAVTEEVK